MRNLIATSACLGAIILASTAHAAPADRNMGPDRITGGHGHAGAFHHARRDRAHHRGGFGYICGKRREARTERMIGVVEGLMTFDTTQEAAWNDFTKAVRDSNKSMNETCAGLRQDKDTPANATGRLARMEAMLAAGLKFVRTVRPKFDRFYATLNDKQKEAFDSLARHRRRH
jgi:hypothetical protein